MAVCSQPYPQRGRPTMREAHNAEGYTRNFGPLTLSSSQLIWKHDNLNYVCLYKVKNSVTALANSRNILEAFYFLSYLNEKCLISSVCRLQTANLLSLPCRSLWQARKPRCFPMCQITSHNHSMTSIPGPGMRYSVRKRRWNGMTKRSLPRSLLFFFFFSFRPFIFPLFNAGIAPSKAVNILVRQSWHF